MQALPAAYLSTRASFSGYQKLICTSFFSLGDMGNVNFVRQMFIWSQVSTAEFVDGARSCPTSGR